MFQTAAPSKRQVVAGLAVLAAIAVVGLYVVKWNPYYERALAVTATHSLGGSILTGSEPTRPAVPLVAALDYARSYFMSVWQALVLGLVLAATVEALLPRDWLARVLGSETFRRTALGGVLALPGMMCTCCASPVVVSMRRGGVAPGTCLAFWLGSPTLNPAVLVFMFFTLGWKWVLLRLGLGLLLVFGVAWAVGRFLLAGATSQAAPMAMDRAPTAAVGTWLTRWLESFRRLVVQLMPEYLAIVLALGAAQAWLFPEAGAELGNSPLAIVGLAVAGMLFTIPTAGEIPIIQTMMGYGLGSGPAGALLMTLAPVSLPSLLMLRREFPARVLAAVAAAVVTLGIIAGTLAVLLSF